MQNTTLCYIECNGKCLLMHRNKKPHDANEGKWIGIGGHIKEGESPEECVIRETKEETGIELCMEDLHYRGIITFKSDSGEGEYMHLFWAVLSSAAVFPNCGGVMCDEGTLSWIDISKMDLLPQWEGDKIFLRLMKEDVPFFSLKLVYKCGRLAAAALNGRPYSLSAH